MDAKQVWRAALGELQVSLSPANFETWLKDTALVAVDDTLFRVAVPSGFAKDWLESRYRSLISQTLARVVGYSVTSPAGSAGRAARRFCIQWAAAGTALKQTTTTTAATTMRSTFLAMTSTCPR